VQHVDTDVPVVLQVRQNDLDAVSNGGCGHG
jgi:hypothetical protein